MYTIPCRIMYVPLPYVRPLCTGLRLLSKLEDDLRLLPMAGPQGSNLLHLSDVPQLIGIDP